MPDSTVSDSTLPDSGAPGEFRWKTNATLFVLTLLSTFMAGAAWVSGQAGEEVTLARALATLPRGWVFALPLMSILLCHEFGHYIAARLHGVRASLPYFLPLPLIGSFGTLGAVIAMPRNIPSRRALLDIGAAGPLAGLVVAIPMLVVGLSLSPVHELPKSYDLEGQSLLYLAIKYLVLGPIPEGHDVLLHPTALAAWVGLFVTMLNLLPWGQLDGGHIAYALFGERQNRYARILRSLLLPVFLLNLARFSYGLMGTPRMPFTAALFNSSLPLTWFILTGILGYFFGHDHPPIQSAGLDRKRRWIAALCLLLFVVLFMPTLMERHGGLQ